MSPSVTPAQRFTRSRPCPICRGYEGAPRGQGKRCTGYVTTDGDGVFCERVESGKPIDSTPPTWFHPLAERKGGNGLVEQAVYTYRNEDRSPRYDVVRFIDARGEKTFRMRRPGGTWGLGEVGRVLYRLPELAAHEGTSPVYIVEGEKDVDTLTAKGCTATCNPNGAGKWHFVAEHARKVLKGRDVLVVADADDVGRKHAREVAASLEAVASVRVVECAKGKDVTDHLAAGGTLDELVPLDVQSDPAKVAASWEDGPPEGFDDEPASDPREEPTATEPLRGLEHLSKVAVYGRDRLKAIAAAPVHFVWGNIAVAATITLLAAGPGEGKTTLLFLLLAARLNLGDPVRVLGYIVEPAQIDKWVVVIEGEHSESSAVRKLLRSMKLLAVNDVALGRVLLVARKAVRLGSPEWFDVVRLVAAGLVSDIAIDTIARVAPADGNSEQEQMVIFDCVAQAIEVAPSIEDKPTVWAAAHTRKNGRTGEVADVAGSVQRTGQADSVLMLTGEKVDGRTVSARVVFAKLREEPDDYPMPVSFSIDGDNITLSTGEPEDADERPLESRIEEELQKGARTGAELRKTLRRSGKAIQEGIGALFSARRITTTYKKVGKREERAFVLRGPLGATDPMTPE